MLALDEKYAERDCGYDTPCWIWTRAMGTHGYGVAYEPDTGKTTTAHRAVYEFLVSPIPDGLEIDHLCRVKPCVNPDHLELVSRGENLRRKPPATHCRKGHEYTPENTYYSSRSWGLERVCRTCHRARVARYKEKKKCLAI